MKEGDDEKAAPQKEIAQDKTATVDVEAKDKTKAS